MGSGCVHDHFNPRHNLKCDKFIFQMMQIIWGHFGERDFQTSGFDSACLSITMTHSAERLALSHGASDSLLSAQAGGRWDSMRHRKSRGWAERMSWNYVSRGTLCFLIFILNVLSFYFGFCIFIQVQAGGLEDPINNPLVICQPLNKYTYYHNDQLCVFDVRPVYSCFFIPIWLHNGCNMLLLVDIDIKPITDIN